MSNYVDIHESFLRLGVNLEDFSSPNLAYESLFADNELDPTCYRTSNRLSRGFRLWANVPISEYPDHWMAPHCSTINSYMNIPIEELYGKTTLWDLISSTGYLDRVDEHIVLYLNEGVSSIIYNCVNGVTADDFQMMHPYAAASSLHELFRLLLEWQWARLYADNVEPMSSLADQTLTSMGLHIDQQDEPGIVQDLMTLPDMQVSRYVSGQDVVVNAEDVPCPPSFREFVATSGFFDFGQLYQGELPHNEVMKLKDLIY